MMIDKRLIGLVPESRRYIAANVALQWVALGANILLVGAVSGLLATLWQGHVDCRPPGWNRSTGPGCFGGAVCLCGGGSPDGLPFQQNGQSPAAYAAV